MEERLPWDYGQLLKGTVSPPIYYLQPPILNG